MASTCPSRALQRTCKAGWLTSAVLLIGLFAALPGAPADTIAEWNLIAAGTLQAAKAGPAWPTAASMRWCTERCSTP